MQCYLVLPQCFFCLCGDSVSFVFALDAGTLAVLSGPLCQIASLSSFKGARFFFGAEAEISIVMCDLLARL